MQRHCASISRDVSSSISRGFRLTESALLCAHVLKTTCTSLPGFALSLFPPLHYAAAIPHSRHCCWSEPLPVLIRTYAFSSYTSAFYIQCHCTLDICQCLLILYVYRNRIGSFFLFFLSLFHRSERINLTCKFLVSPSKAAYYFFANTSHRRFVLSIARARSRSKREITVERMIQFSFIFYDVS